MNRPARLINAQMPAKAAADHLAAEAVAKPFPRAGKEGKMLVLSRKQGERIQIGGAMLTVLKLTGAQVRLGVDAPREVVIVRGELRDQSENTPRSRPRARKWP